MSEYSIAVGVTPYTAIALIVALAPAVTAYWLGRRLWTGVDADAALPERWQALLLRLQQVAMVVVISLIAAAPLGTLWALPVCWLATTAATHPLRRRLYGETWSIGARMLWQLRATLALRGYWLVLAVTPSLMWLAPQSRATAIAVGALLVAWNIWFVPVTRALLGARAIDSTGLLEPFEAVLTQARCARPLLMRAGPRGGLAANAFAVPGRRGSMVVFFDSLLGHLTPAENTAILAHEVAHLEYWEPRLTWRLWLWALATIAVAVGSAPVTAAFDLPPALGIACATAVVLVALVRRANQMRPQETESDLRAVALCGDPETLIRALVRLHELARAPRRADAAREQQQSHPSLARRIRDIRSLATTPEPAIAFEPLVAASPVPGRFAVLDAQRVSFVWTSPESQPASGTALLASAWRIEARRYDELRELRVAVGRSGPPELTFADMAWQRQSMPLAPDAVASLQHTLDILDQRLAKDAGVRRLNLAGIARAVTLMALVFSVTIGGVLALIAPVLLALVRPAAGPLAAVAAAAMVTLAVVGRHSANLFWCAASTIPVAVALAWMAWRQRRDDTDPPLRVSWLSPAAFDRVALAVLAIVATAASAAALVAGHRALWDLHDVLRRDPVPAATLAALAACLVCGRAVWTRRTACAVATVAAGAMALGASAIATRLVDDPLIAPASAFVERTAAFRPLTRVVPPFDRYGLELSPSGRYFALRHRDDDDEDEPTPALIGDFTGWMREIEARDVAFLDDDRLLRLDVDTHDTTTLTIESVRSGERTGIDADFSGVYGESLFVRGGGAWTVLGAGSRDQVVRLDGRLGRVGVSRAPWHDASPFDHEYITRQLVDDEASSLAVGMVWTYPTTLETWLGRRPPGSSSLFAMTTAGPALIARTKLALACLQADHGRGFHCLAFDGVVTRIWTIDGRARGLRLAGAVEGRLDSPTAGPDDTIVALRNGRAVVLRLDRLELLTAAGPCPTPCRQREAAYAANRLAVLERDRRMQTSVMTLLAIEEPAPVSAPAGRSARAAR
jgi:Zn-dependent protease with chaperone function